MGSSTDTFAWAWRCYTHERKTELKTGGVDLKDVGVFLAGWTSWKMSSCYVKCRIQAATLRSENWSQQWSVKNCSSLKGRLSLAPKANPSPQTPMLKYSTLQQKWMFTAWYEKRFWSLELISSFMTTVPGWIFITHLFTFYFCWGLYQTPMFLYVCRIWFIGLEHLCGTCLWSGLTHLTFIKKLQLLWFGCSTMWPYCNCNSILNNCSALIYIFNVSLCLHLTPLKPLWIQADYS